MNAYLIPALKATPRLIEKQLEVIPIEAWDAPTHPERFSAREVIAHLADWEPILLSRMQQCVDSPGSKLLPYDEGDMALANGYSKQDPHEALRRFQDARRETISWLTEMPAENWAKSANHPERGTLTVYDIANMIACHDVYHVEQLSFPS